jgi:hypothetical protein
MSFSAIDALLRERRLAAMRAEVEQSLDAPPLEAQPGHGYDPDQLLLGGNPAADSWASTGMEPSAELAATAPPYTFPVSAPTIKVAAGGWPTGVWPRPGLPLPFPPDAWEPWRQGAEQGIKGLIDAWRRVFSGSAGGTNDPDCDKEWDEARALCRKEFAKPYPSRNITGGYRDVESCARGHVSQRCGGNSFDDTPRGRR